MCRGPYISPQSTRSVRCESLRGIQMSGGGESNLIRWSKGPNPTQLGCGKPIKVDTGATKMRRIKSARWTTWSIFRNSGSWTERGSAKKTDVFNVRAIPCYKGSSSQISAESPVKRPKAEVKARTTVSVQFSHCRSFSRSVRGVAVGVRRRLR